MYEHITPESLRQEMLENINYWSKNEGAMVSTLLAAPAYAIWQWYTNLEAVQFMIFPDENSGIWIDKNAAQVGITRKEGEAAKCQMQLTGNPGIKIPAGKVFQTPGGIKFTTDQDVILDSYGHGTVDATCTLVGVLGNVDAEELTIQGSMTRGLKSWTNTEATGGIDPETDSSLLSRYYERLRMPATSGNVYHYQQWAREVPGVGAVKVYPLWDGPGTVKLVLAGDGYTVPDEEVVQAAADYIETVRPIGADVTVEAATALTVTVAATVTLDDGGELEKIKTEFEAKLAEYLLSLAFSVKSEVILTFVGHLLSECSGVYDYTGLTLNGQAENLTVNETDIPIMGEVNLGESG